MGGAAKRTWVKPSRSGRRSRYSGSRSPRMAVARKASGATTYRRAEYSSLSMLRCSYRCLTCAPMVLEHEHDPERVPLYRFLGPRYWLLWLGLGLVRALNTLPLRAQMAVGRLLGRVACSVSRRDRRIADINVRLCLPGLTAQERADLVKDHFQSLG